MGRHGSSACATRRSLPRASLSVSWRPLGGRDDRADQHVARDVGQASWSAPLHLFANRKGEELQQPVEESPVPPPLVVDLLRVRQIVGKDLLELARDVLVVQD